MQGLTTPDGTVLISHHRHDFRTHTDKNGKFYFIDGGSDYTRTTNHGDERFFTVDENDDWETQRLFFGRYNVPTDKFTTLARMSNDYLINAYIYALANQQPTDRLSTEIDYRAYYNLTVNENGEYTL